MKKYLILSVGATALLMAGFQNCTQTNFSSSADSAQAKSQSSEFLTPMEDEDADTNGDSVDDQIVQGPQLGNQNAPRPPVAHEGRDDSKTSDHDFVACILVDHGKSLKLGLIGTDAGGVHSVAESVCVTRSACLGEVAKHFQVEGAYERGYCEHNPHVRRLSDSEVKELCNKSP